MFNLKEKYTIFFKSSGQYIGQIYRDASYNTRKKGYIPFLDENKNFLQINEYNKDGINADASIYVPINDVERIEVIYL